MHRVEFHALGPLEISVDGQVRSPGGNTQRGLLAILLLNTNQVVPVREIIGELWDDPPETALGQIQTRVWRLRTLLNGSAGKAGGTPLVTRPGGYMLQADQASLDFGRFETGVGDARALFAAGKVETAASLLEEALTLWRGPAFSDVDVPGVRAAAATLEELRLAAVEERVEADLALGRHRRLVPELQVLLIRHPLNERLRGQLMLALYRSERQAEALQTYRDGHRLLVAELGLEPRQQLQDLHHAILTRAPRLDLSRLRTQIAPVAAGPGRRELPPDIADFTGRSEEIGALTAFLSGSADGSALTVAAISGRAGAGKTALAVHVAHRLADRFPDGQFFVDLRGLDRRPAVPATVLARLLHRLGVEEGAIPVDMGERCALYRAHMAERRVLLVLDNARNEAQVRPLLPAGYGSAVIVTSRRRAGGLENARSFDLDVLTEGEAVELLSRIAGEERARAREEARCIVELCGRLPLAIRVAGAKLTSRPHWQLNRLADLLQDERGRLDTLTAGELEVRTSVALSYDDLDEPAARLFRLLGTLEAPTFAGWVAGPLLDLDDAQAEELMESLVEARLIDVARVEDSGVVRYRIHDLLRLYARERVAEEEPQESVHEALRRTFGRALFLVEQAQARLPGGPQPLARGTALRTPMPPQEVERLLADPFAWFESEQQTLASVADQACTRGLDEMSWEICCCLGRFLQVRWYAGAWLDTNLRALEASRRAGNRRGEAHLLRSLGELYLDLDRYGQALRCLQDAERIFTELGDDRCAAHARCGAAVAHARTGRLGTALRELRRALAVFGPHSDVAGAARALHTLGNVHLDLGRHDVAMSCYDESLSLFGSLGDQMGRGLVLRHIGVAHLAMGDLGAARPLLELSLEIFRECGSPIGEGFALAHLGSLYGGCGEKDAAHGALAQALALFATTGDRFGRALTLHHLGVRYAAEGEPGRAHDCLDQASHLWQELGFALWEARTKQAGEEV